MRLIPTCDGILFSKTQTHFFSLGLVAYEMASSLIRVIDDDIILLRFVTIHA